MTKRSMQHIIEYETVESVAELAAVDRTLLQRSLEASKLAYAPYSRFNVGAAALLSNEEIVVASNKENASFPAGICAERNLLNYVSDHYPNDQVVSLAIQVNPVDYVVEAPVSPCGICRQVMCETEKNQNCNMRVLLKGSGDKVMVFSSAASLLPFHFYLSELKR